jgi:2-oxoglutarate dehydrogenase E1 component
MSVWDELGDLNRAYLLEQYDRYREDPNQVDPQLAKFFASAPPPPEAGEARPLRAAGAVDVPLRTIAAVGAYAGSIRRYGHLAGQIDPLGSPPIGDPALLAETHGLRKEDLDRLPASLVGGLVCEEPATASEAIEILRRVYMSTIGYDYAHVFIPEERSWLRDAAECGRFRAPEDPIDPVALLERLTEVEVFERFLHRSFPGKTRFSIEGLDMLVPVLDEVIGEAAEADTRHVLIGMAHRGRLNVLAHVLHKPYSQILAEFKDPVRSRSFNEDMAWAGDVKYHMGAHRAIPDGEEVPLWISMPPNPSHLEAIDPVVEGMARAAGTTVKGGGIAHFNPLRTLPILIHGDSAFPGQGVVAETLNLSRLDGYLTGGTIHIISNNQLGFTTRPEDAYSTSYASGLARGFKIPIVHVNADDVEACIEAARLAFAYRARFQKDFLIDLVGYRRYGHNEGDEPSFTQPLMYKRIVEHPTVRERWARQLIERGVIPPELPDRLVEQRMNQLQDALEALQPEQQLVEPVAARPPEGAARDVRTGVPLQRLRALNQTLLELPAQFNAHRKLDRARERRRTMLDDADGRTVDWAAAEELAFASIIEDGVAIRLTGQDVERGTFSHRHAVLHDVQTGAQHIPLQHLPQARAAFEVHNSPLSENAVLGFEYGYNIQQPERFVVWEAQYGDFINGAQTVIDEFIVSARVKWGQTPSLVMLLPHGQEGQGPDHASARAERFLQLAADLNMRIANCTTAAQYFHLLRRQAALLTVDPLPLVVFTPKSLLRHPLVASAPGELAEGRWQPVIGDARPRKSPRDVRRLVLCSGKIYVDLTTDGRYEQAAGVAIVRVEQLYPLPAEEIAAEVSGYPELEEVLWVQEEPANMGAWDFMRPRLEEILGGRWPLRYVGRPANPSPAEGSAARHARTQAAIVGQALTGATKPAAERVGAER